MNQPIYLSEVPILSSLVAMRQKAADGGAGVVKGET